MKTIFRQEVEKNHKKSPFTLVVKRTFSFFYCSKQSALTKTLDLQHSGKALKAAQDLGNPGPYGPSGQAKLQVAPPLILFRSSLFNFFKFFILIYFFGLPPKYSIFVFHKHTYEQNIS